MPFLGLFDWILIAAFFLLIGFGVLCVFLHLLFEWVHFKPEFRYEPSTFFNDAYGNYKYVEAPRLHYKFRYERELKLKWYHELIGLAL